MSNFDFDFLSQEEAESTKRKVNWFRVSRLEKEPWGNGNFFAVYNKEALYKVMRFLSPVSPAFALWMIIGSNTSKTGFIFEYDPQIAENSYGLQRDDFYKGIDELEAKGFLVPVDEENHTYTFIEYPESVQEYFEPHPTEEEKEEIKAAVSRFIF